jgi:plasmid stability protein
MIQIRNVPAGLHRKLKARAAGQRMSLSDYLLKEVEHLAEQPTLEEMRERLSRRKPVILRRSPASIIRAERDRRDRR